VDRLQAETDEGGATGTSAAFGQHGHDRTHSHPHDHHHHPYPHANHPLGPVTLPKIPGKLARAEREK